MLFFRSEEAVRDWCRANDRPLRPLVTMPQLWQMAQAWYSTRLEAVARRPQPAEITEIFARIGLTGDHWDPRADRLG